MNIPYLVRFKLEATSNYSYKIKIKQQLMYTSGQQTPKLLSPVSLLRTTEDEMVGWHHQLGGHEFEQAPGVGDGLGGLVCCSPWGHKELDMTERLS